MLALGFSRIIELELCNRIIMPLLSKVGYERLSSELLNAEKLYKNKWQSHIKTYRDIIKNGTNGKMYMLAELNNIFTCIGSKYDEMDNIATVIRDNLSTILNEHGIDKFNSGIFENITGREIRDKYRNPPAHTKYLEYSVVEECRNVVKKFLIEISDIII